jgi:hypothetical protein
LANEWLFRVHHTVPRALFGGGIIDKQFIYPFERLQRLYQMRSLRMLETTKKSDVIRLSMMPASGRILARNVAGELFSALASDDGEGGGAGA